MKIHTVVTQLLKENLAQVIWIGIMQTYTVRVSVNLSKNESKFFNELHSKCFKHSFYLVFVMNRLVEILKNTFRWGCIYNKFHYYPSANI